MTTHRSLNKLEFKAHMSIHNKVEVSEGETHDANYTRDRFGKTHLLAEADGESRVRRRRSASIGILAIILLNSFLFSHDAFASKRSTDVTVESEHIDKKLMEDKLNPPDERFAFYRDGDTSVELNENGDPNMNYRF